MEESSSPDWKPGDEVVVTGCGLSETAWGGYAELARVDAHSLVRLPEGLTLKQAMAIGTAGFTAMQCVVALERHGLTPGTASQPKDVLVTGAAGGVGSIAVAILAKLGYRVVASTGRAELGDYLRSLGASEIIDRAALAAPSKRPMETERWAGAVDTVGGDTLAAIVRALVANGSVAACGVAGGAALNTTVYPFILRGVNLLGINSVYVSRSDRLLMWERLTRDLPLPSARQHDPGSAARSGVRPGREDYRRSGPRADRDSGLLNEAPAANPLAHRIRISDRRVGEPLSPASCPLE